MRSIIFCVLVFISLSIKGQEISEPLRGFMPLIGKTWIAYGEWGNGSQFKQEIQFSTKLNGNMVVTESYGYTDQEQTVFGHRNHGIRKWNEEKGIIEFVEYDVFGGVTEGNVAFEGENIYYNYEYGSTVVTDAWIRINDYSYQFKVGNYKDGNWSQVFLDTKFYLSPEYTGPKEDYAALMQGMKAFSTTYMNEDHEGIANFYTEEGKIMPNGTPIIQGRAAIAERWKLREGTDIIHHSIHPVEIHIQGDTAYDYGYYEGSTKVDDQEPSHFIGKYVIIWKKMNGKWLIDVDIWNRVNN